MDKKRIIQVDEKVPPAQLVPLSIQHVFAMFGASVLVPILFGIHSGIVLFMNGIGTLLFIFLTKGKAPAYLGSSFAFLAPAGIVIAELGFEYAQGGFVVTGLLGCLLALVVWKFGTDWIDIVLPPAAMGPVVALIGLELAANTVKGGAIGADLMAVNPEGGLMLSPTMETGDILVFAVTLHNIPEGMAVGLSFALAAQHGGDAALYTAAMALAIGIGIQNFPEGAARTTITRLPAL